jgi:serine/threonine-protein kinase
MLHEYQDPPELAQRRVGSTLKGRFTLLSTVSIGGTAWIYKAWDEAGIHVAVKILHRRLNGYPQVRNRFVREARIANLIDHAGVVHVDDDGETEDGVPFLVMPLLEGETFEARLERKGGRLPLAEVMWAADQVLSILDAAHKKGIVHRDVKPENVFLTSQQTIKLLDFGIARLHEHVPTMEATVEGTLLGTLDFMSPEQARGEVDKIGVQADLWSVGATMFRLLSGHFVHEEDRIIEQIKATMSKRAPPLRSVAPEVPEEVALMVDYALEFDAPQRWPNARAMRNALMVANASLREEPPSSSNPASSESGRLIVSAAPEAPPMSMRRPPSRT